MWIHLCPQCPNLMSSTVTIIFYLPGILFFCIFHFSYLVFQTPTCLVLYLHNSNFIWYYHKGWHIKHIIYYSLHFLLLTAHNCSYNSFLHYILWKWGTILPFASTSSIMMTCVAEIHLLDLFYRKFLIIGVNGHVIQSFWCYQNKIIEMWWTKDPFYYCLFSWYYWHGHLGAYFHWK